MDIVRLINVYVISVYLVLVKKKKFWFGLLIWGFFIKCIFFMKWFSYEKRLY